MINNLFFKRYMDIDATNTIKLLVRAQKFYEARDKAIKILKSLVELYSKFDGSSAFSAVL